jgi:hypothetical protein
MLEIENKYQSLLKMIEHPNEFGCVSYQRNDSSINPHEELIIYLNESKNHLLKINLELPRLELYCYHLKYIDEGCYDKKMIKNFYNINKGVFLIGSIVKDSGSNESKYVATYKATLSKYMDDEEKQLCKKILHVFFKITRSNSTRFITEDGTHG